MGASSRRAISSRSSPQALSNLTTVVEAAGGRAEHVVRLTIYVKSRDDYVAKLKPLGEVYRRYFGGHYPAMALFEVSGFFQPDALVEIEGIAVLEKREGLGQVKAKKIAWL